MKQLPLGVRLPDHALFSTWVSGSNEPVLQLLQALAAGRDEPAVLIWSAGATGKTHLLQALCTAAAEIGRRSGYLSPGAGESEPHLLEGWEQLQVVCLDDIDKVAGTASWEDALFALYQGLREQGGSLVCASGTAPGRLDFRLPDLASRLFSGPVFALRPLSDGQLAAALVLRAARQGLVLPEETVAYLMRRYPRDIAVLCRLLDRLDQASLATGRRLTVPFAREVLGSAE